MDHRNAIHRAIAEAGIQSQIATVHALAGGCIHHASRIELSTGEQLVAKTGPASVQSRFEEELAGLKALAETSTVLVPRPIRTTVHHGVAVLLMEYIEPARSDAKAWARLGEELAALHRAHAGVSYGFEINNHIGATPQVNTWAHDWVVFNAEHRLGYQARLASENNLLSARELRIIDSLIDHLDRFIPRTPGPALLHGDLWSGNVLPTVNGRIAVIDPAPSVGDGWADIAMMQLFGGFDQACFEAYAANMDDADDVETRLIVYQIYHLLNHVNIFGRGYVSQLMSLVQRLIQ